MSEFTADCVSKNVPIFERVLKSLIRVLSVSGRQEKLSYGLPHTWREKILHVNPKISASQDEDFSSFFFNTSSFMVYTFSWNIETSTWPPHCVKKPGADQA